jgi:hypothetical protein
LRLKSRGTVLIETKPTFTCNWRSFSFVDMGDY